MTVWRGPRGWAQVRAGVMSPVALVTALPLLSAAVAFVVNILTARALGAEARGIIALVLQVSYLATPLVLLGRERALLRRDSPPTLVTPIVLLASVACLPWIHETMWLAIPATIISAYVTMARSAVLVGDRPGGYLIAGAGLQFSILSGTLLLYLLEVDDVLLWLVPYAFPAVVVAAWEVIEVFRSRQPLAKGYFRYLGLMPASVAALAVMRMERLLLPAIGSVRELGVYIVAATAIEPVAWLAQAVADRSTAGREGTRAAWWRHLRRVLPVVALGSIGMGAALWLAAVPVFGPEFHAIRELVVPLALSTAILAAYRLAIAQLLAGVAPGRSSVADGLTACLALPTYGYAIQWAGAVGAAWGCVAVYSLGVGVSLAMLPAREKRPAEIAAKPSE